MRNFFTQAELFNIFLLFEERLFKNLTPVLRIQSGLFALVPDPLPFEPKTYKISLRKVDSRADFHRNILRGEDLKCKLSNLKVTYLSIWLLNGI
jgi:hypothetical protein